MDAFTATLVCIGLLSLFTGVWSFYGESNKSNADGFDFYNAGISLQEIFIGVILLAIFISSFAISRNTSTAEYAMSYFFLAIALLGLLLGILTVLSRDAERFLGRLIRRTDSGDKAYLLMAFFGLSAAFFFAFFLFYPPFLSIG